MGLPSKATLEVSRPPSRDHDTSILLGRVCIPCIALGFGIITPPRCGPLGKSSRLWPLAQPPRKSRHLRAPTALPNKDFKAYYDIVRTGKLAFNLEDSHNKYGESVLGTRVDEQPDIFCCRGKYPARARGSSCQRQRLLGRNSDGPFANDLIRFDRLPLWQPWLHVRSRRCSVSPDTSRSAESVVSQRRPAQFTFRLGCQMFPPNEKLASLGAK